MTDKSKNLFCKSKKTYNASQNLIVFYQKNRSASLLLALGKLSVLLLWSLEVTQRLTPHGSFDGICICRDSRKEL
ncbi:hypothetical protein [Leptospira noguchii]|uniref:Uncharacterized protein n=1 Tax=Leptospira noguchii TaxID=28182 RepID=A0A9Q8RJ28_9LEPT|nr:hypothetical protein [Leptospira noguchii]TQE62865.1 hypothetical protein FF021_20525 [Leptospira noguchii]UOG30170.1 hypothetical protein MAL06_16510 [Leptospira noguchii]UOG52292.1 hypothetical protein MAL09_17110 [Leptospira noguchii]UOG56288.1 hypothetical protein MAL03_15980 [Leptospira noguchii]